MKFAPADITRAFTALFKAVNARASKTSLQRDGPPKPSSKTRFWGYGLGLALIAALHPGQARDLGLNLPDMGDPSAAVVSPTDETAIGAAFLARLRAQHKLIEDPEINDYVQYLGGRITAQTNRGAAGFRFFVVADDSVNAFAAPGGLIGIHTGLFRVATTEGEMAAVLAHETAHVTQRHLARTFEAANQYSLPVAAALISAALLSGANPDLAQASIAGLIAGQAQSQVNFTRENEQEADRVGLHILVAAGYDAHNMANGFQRLLDAVKRPGESPPEYLRTHPLTIYRIAQAQDRASQLARIPPEDDLPYQLIRAKLKVLGARKQDALTHYAAQPQGLAAARYGLALAQIENDQFADALAILEELTRHDPERAAYHLAAVAALNRSGQPQAALRRLRSALRLWPGSYPLSMLQARILITQRQDAEAVRILSRLAVERPNDPNVFKLSSLVKERSGNVPGAYLDLARQHELVGRLEAAIQQLRLAQRLPNLDEPTAARIDAQLERLERLQEAAKTS